MFVTITNINCNVYELITTAFSSNHFSFPSRHQSAIRERSYFKETWEHSITCEKS